ncbi:MAG: AAA family ATPase, partial [Dehalococcoidia bacterium]
MSSVKCPSCGRENPAVASFCMACAARLTPPTELAPSPSVEFPTSTGFVGREWEIGELKRILDDVLSAQGRLVMLAGEPGIGKTRTSQELASAAEDRGFQVFWGWCYEEDGAPPYWPWIQPLRSYFQKTGGEHLASQMGSGASVIAEIVPEAREKLPGLERPPSLEPEQARFRLFDSITTFLKNAAQTQPLLLVLDDLHWADKPSLLLLQFLARQLTGNRILVVGSYRDVELSRQYPLSDTLAQLTRESTFRRMPLRGLNQEASGSLIEVIAGFQPPQRLADIIYTHTEGNPFFLTETVKLLAERGALGTEEVGELPGMTVPESVREVIGQRLNRRSAECNRVLANASLIGREFSLEVLGRLLDELSADRLLEVVEEALTARVVEEVLGIGARYRFSHALIQETLASELSAARRMGLHARIGAVIEELYQHESDAHAGELAHHFNQAMAISGPEKFIKYSLAAGEQALAAYAWEEAQSYFQRALVAKGQRAIDAETAALWSGLGRAQAGTLERQQIQQAIDTLSRAFEYYVDV